MSKGTAQMNKAMPHPRILRPACIVSAGVAWLVEAGRRIGVSAAEGRALPAKFTGRFHSGGGHNNKVNGANISFARADWR